MRVDFLTCDVFTSTPYRGNPLLVVPDARGLSTAQMQAIAREINYSESTFVLPPDDPRHAYRQRTFVPMKEIPYAGHPTVGTALAMSWLGRVGTSGETSITIEVGFGPLALDLIRTDGAVTRIRMEQGKPAWGAPVTSPELLGKIASGIDVPYDAIAPGAHPLPVQTVSTGNRFLMLPLPSVELVSGADADPRVLSLVERELDVLGIYLFAPAEGGRVRARAFCPGAGVPEDPATGSAAGPLGVYLALHRALPGGAPRFLVDQGLEMGRDSELEVEAVLDVSGAPVGVRVAGSGVKMMQGWLEV